jgi:voltage-gated potassium channel Kch
MGSEVRWTARLRYALDNTFSKGAVALIAWLGLLSVVIIVLAALALTLTGLAQAGEQSLGFSEAFWQALMRTLDAGTMGGDTGWGFRLIMLAVTVGGVFVISTFIGVLTTGIEGKLEDLRKGRSQVIESGHTVILGWSEQIFTVISELVAANENQHRSCLVILADRDKVEMEGEIAEKVEDTGRTRVVCRTGRPMEMAHLGIVSLNTAKSIIVLAPDSDEADAEVIKTALALTHHPNHRAQPYNIVAELRDPKNLDVARVAGKDEVEWVLVGDLVARVIAQTCRQSGLSTVYTELLDFGGDEIYFTHEPALVGRTFDEALLWYEKNAVLGLAPAGGHPEPKAPYGQGAPLQLNPPMDTVLQPGDQLILVAEDDDKIMTNTGGPGRVSEEAIVSRPAEASTPEQTLILGWNWRGPAILRELDQYVAPGSQALIVADLDSAEFAGSELARFVPDPSALPVPIPETGTLPEPKAPCGSVAGTVAGQALRHEQVSFQRGDTTHRRTLEDLALERFDHIIVLCYSDSLAPQQADARTLITLLHLRDIAERRGYRFSIVSEMLDIRNRNLADVTRADDFVVSDKLVSLILAQVSENKHLNAVFADMFDPEGSEIYLKPAGQYVRLGQPVNFYTVVEAARRRGEVAFGYRLQAHAREAARQYGVVINPAKSESVTFGEADRVIVLAES